MCTAIAEGGRRCAAHLEPDFKQAIASLKASGNVISDESQILELLPPLEAYASTPKGGMIIYKMIEEKVEEKMNSDEWKDFNFATALNLDDSNNTYSRRRFLAQQYFQKNDSIIALLINAEIRGREQDHLYREKENAYWELQRKTLESLKKKPLTPNAEVGSAYQQIAEAISSGASLPAPAGAIAFQVEYSEASYDGAENDALGVYDSMDAAKRGAVKYIFNAIEHLEDMSGDMIGPWGDSGELGLLEWQRRKVEWFNEHSSDEILEWAAKKINKEISTRGYVWTVDNTTFDITPIKIESASDVAIKAEEHFQD